MTRLYGSLDNRLMEKGVAIAPTVGMGATVLMYSDRYAATVIEVASNGKQVVVQHDNAIRTDSNGQSDSQQYRYEPDTRGMKETYSLRRNGRWVLVGDPVSGGQCVRLGARDHHYDYSF